MAVTAEVLEQVRTALERAEQVEAAGIEVAAGDGALVLRGAVPTAEQAETAAVIASWLTDVVENRLRVDPHLREDASDPAPEHAQQARQRPPRGDELSVQSSAATPEAMPRDLQTDAHDALAENTPLDPPDAPQGAPTPAEQRGVSDRDTETERTAEAGEQAEDGARSLADLSQEELERSARRDAEGGAG